ncbi:hypothetical protein JCM19037_4805 [Geomicrobium sp. JCM 19037]|uniref:DUF2273 domain-containing protein n=1 Tax=unclassified Geomicrobium TaxID=2628951 RepID=UPI00045F1B0D|nr:MULTISPECIES: DUF2273 domain-containing protein [unclassified Geomicrobium]GAK06225.1 hypothetical protein JCM19037_4805 [Geomicrobium sp. JCM 19037]GAK12129.1 hypothetical protein JCM19039_1869 [Geomicrobium sp. JCM 19039]
MENTEVFARYRGRIIGILAAILFSVLFFYASVSVAITVFIFLFVGYILGKWVDGDLNVAGYINALFQRRR